MTVSGPVFWYPMTARPVYKKSQDLGQATFSPPHMRMSWDIFSRVEEPSVCRVYPFLWLCAHFGPWEKICKVEIFVDIESDSGYQRGDDFIQFVDATQSRLRMSAFEDLSTSRPPFTTSSISGEALFDVLQCQCGWRILADTQIELILRTVRSVVNGQSVLFYHNHYCTPCRLNNKHFDTELNLTHECSARIPFTGRVY